MNFVQIKLKSRLNFINIFDKTDLADNQKEIHPSEPLFLRKCRYEIFLLKNLIIFPFQKYL